MVQGRLISQKHNVELYYLLEMLGGTLAHNFMHAEISTDSSQTSIFTEKTTPSDSDHPFSISWSHSIILDVFLEIRLPLPQTKFE